MHPAISTTLDPAKARVVLLFLLAVSVRPVEDEDGDPEESRPPLYLRRTALADHFEEFATRSKVRAALGIRRNSARSLGRNTLFAVIDGVAAAAHATAVEAASAEVREAEQALTDEERRATEAECEPDPSFLRGLWAAQRNRSEALGYTGRNACAVDTRTHGRASSGRHLLRLRRDVMLDGERAWEEVLGLFADEAPDYEDALQEAEDLGFSLTAPIPADWVRAVRFEGWGDDDEDLADDGPEVPASPAPDPMPKAPGPRPSRTFDAPPPPPLPDPDEFVSRRPAVRPTDETSETVSEYVERLRAEGKAKVARDHARLEAMRRQEIESRPRFWECASCGSSPRTHYAPAPPSSRCGVCGHTSFR